MMPRWRRDDRIEVRQGATLERTVDLAPGKVRLSLAGVKVRSMLDPSKAHGRVWARWSLD